MSSKRHRPFLCLTIVLSLLLGSSPLQAQSDPEGWVVFGRSGKLFTNFKPIPHWPRLLERYREEDARDARCRGGQGGRCPYRDWTRMIERLGGKDRLTQIEEVNRFANQWSYITDPVNWGVEDYWATPGEFFAKAGDCEDYAIVKFMSLRALGFGNHELRLVAVTDLNLDVGHVVVLVRTGGRTLVLDNQTRRVVEADSIRHYKPVYSANEHAWWLYK